MRMDTMQTVLSNERKESCGSQETGNKVGGAVCGGTEVLFAVLSS